ncbi:hypothetical protein BLNAU_6033 [Blattamonas nauphoetae]|uniref:Protein kinase domain-containing protein n=1 Tax=Blattamonas nauphoetae TaxID=2049346 RepID=A0ABQ9Y5J6_9EUKA|nr:hypothetical protein BLNAU_6033 [Blattamonas nauphoetae]
MPLEDFTLTLKTPQTPFDIIPLPVTAHDLSTGFVLVEVYNKTNTLKYGTNYHVSRITSSSVIGVVLAHPFSTPPEPIRITSAGCSLGGDKQKSALVTLTGVKLGGEKDFNVTVRKMEGSMPVGGEIVLSGTLSGASSSNTHTLSVVIFGNANPLLSFGTKYLITMFKIDGAVSVVDVDVTFFVDPEPPRIVGIETRQLTKDRTTMIILLKGKALLSRTGKVSLTKGSTKFESLSDVNVVDDTHCTSLFAVGMDETSEQLKYGEEYTLKGSWTESNGFHVEDGITVVVPLPPKITKMEFIFSNTLHTGCFVTLTGTDLIVGNSLNVTLNNSLSFIATVTSSTEAKSSELLIGWPTTLQHNTKYEITSIETLNEDDGETLFDSSVSDTTGSLAHPFVISVDSGSSSDSSLFCGDRTRPCSSIEDGWKSVEGLGISSFSISIIHNTTQKDQITLLSLHDVVIESGPSTKPELFVSPSSSSELEGEGMVDVSGGRLWIHQVDVVLSDSPSLIFIRMVGGHLTIETCSFTGHSSSPQLNDLETSFDLCEWESGILNLLNSKTTIKQTDMSHLSQGAINMKGGNLTMHGSIFTNNAPPSSPFPSLRHNIRCSEEGEIEVGSLNGGDGSSDTHPHLWLSHNDCSLSGDDVNVNSPFFIPTLSSSSTSKLNTGKTGFEVSIEGLTLIPCSLFLEVFEKKKDGSVGQPKQFPLTQDSTVSFSETKIEMILPLSSLSEHDPSLEWRGRLGFGKDEITTTSFVIQKNVAERRSQAAKENMNWWLPLAISLSLLFVIVLVVVIVCCRRRRVEEKGTNIEEMSASDQPPIEEEKVDIVTDNRIGVISFQAGVSSERNEETTKKYDPEPSDDMLGFENLEEVLPCCGDMKTTVCVSKDRTLYNALHSEQPWEVRVRQAQLQLVRGLKGVMKQDRDAAILRALTAHNVLFDSKQNVCLKLNLDVSLPAPLPYSTPPQTDQDHLPQEQPDPEQTVETLESKLTAPQSTERVNEGVRWFAPEVISNKPFLNSVNGAVFSLGLLLWEMETGLVPFGEQDAVNASRQIVAGVKPKLELVENKEMRELIEQCLSLNPDDRPDLDTIDSTLVLIPPDKTIHPKEFVQS